MKQEEIKKIAMDMGIKAGRMKKAVLVRAIQHAERNLCCFETGQAETCGQADCLWRSDCV
jgi:hypothetical protein